MKKAVKKEIKNILELYGWSENDYKKGRIDWWHLSRCIELSDDLIREFKNKLDLKIMLKQERISQQFYNELKYGKLTQNSITNT